MMAKPNKHAKPGAGGRFAALKAEIGKEKGISGEEAGAIAASAGKKKWGAKQMGSWAAKGMK